MQHRVAIASASGIVAEAILEKLPESGVAPDSLFLLDSESNAGKRMAYAGGHIKLRDQRQFDFSECSLLVMPEADSELEAAALAAPRRVSDSPRAFSQDLWRFSPCLSPPGT